MKNFIFCIILFSVVSLYGQSYSNLFTPGEEYLLKYEMWEQSQRNEQQGLQLVEPELERKSVAKAFFYSLLLPGLGEAYVGRTVYTKIFMSLEVLGWGFLIGNYQHVSWIKDDYQNFGRQHAGVNQGSKSDEYWINIGKFDNIFEYNEQRRRDRDVAAIYEENAIYYWRWDSYNNRLDYDGRRIHARELEQDDVYYIGAIVLNHIVSAINALRVAKAYNRNLEKNTWQMGVNIDKYNERVSLSLTHQF